MADILVIDDDIEVRIVIRRMLEKKGYDVREASEGGEGIRLYREKPADLIITDILMPGKEGIETIIELRKEFPDIRIIAVSGGGRLGPGDYLELAEKIGVQCTLTKPFTWDELIQAVESLLP